MKAAGLFALLGLVVAGLLIEAGLRLYAEMRAPAFIGASVATDDTQPDPLLVAWFKPNYVAPGGWPAYDSSGFRLNGAPRLESDARPSALLGGSTAYGWDVLDNETTPAVLEQRLRAAGQPNAVVINAGYPGLTSIDTLLVYRAKLEARHPSPVILLAGLNDLYYAVDWIPDNRLRWASRTYELGLRARHDPALRPLVDAVNRFALSNCYTCYAVGAGFSRLYDRTQIVPMLNVATLFGQEPLGGANSRAMQLTAWSIGELARMVRADNGCLIVAWQPIAGVPEGPHTPDEALAEHQIALHAPTWPTVSGQMFVQLREATQPVFASGLATEVDATGVFDGEQNTVYQEDGVHYTALGDRLVAEAILPALSRPGCS